MLFFSLVDLTEEFYPLPINERQNVIGEIGFIYLVHLGGNL
jgi:hypothetical protein